MWKEAGAVICLMLYSALCLAAYPPSLPLQTQGGHKQQSYVSGSETCGKQGAGNIKVALSAARMCLLDAQDNHAGQSCPRAEDVIWRSVADNKTTSSRPRFNALRYYAEYDAQISSGETRQDYTDPRRFHLVAPMCALLFLPCDLPLLWPRLSHSTPDTQFRVGSSLLAGLYARTLRSVRPLRLFR